MTEVITVTYIQRPSLFLLQQHLEELGLKSQKVHRERKVSLLSWFAGERKQPESHLGQTLGRKSLHGLHTFTQEQRITPNFKVD